MKFKACMLLAFVLVLPAVAQVLHVGEMSTEQIRALDRQKTAVIIPGGILEEHGPYLPAFTDGYLSERLTTELAGAVVARPGWKALVFPLVPLGAEGSNSLGRQFDFPGSYTVRSATLRAVFMDLASDLGEQGFRWIFIVHIHGAGLHNRALDDASDFFHDTYGGRMVHLWGLVPVLSAWGQVLQGLPDAQKKEEGVSLHGGMDETSLMLYLQPRLVAPGYRTAPTRTGQTMQASIDVARTPGWPGYLGSPRLGSSVLGEKIWKALSNAFISHALQILDGADPKKFQRYGELLTRVPAYAEADKDALAHEALVEQKQATWLMRRQRSTAASQK